MDNSLLYIDEINNYLREENHKLRQGNNVAEAKLEALKLIHLDYLDIERLDDKDKEKVLYTVDLIIQNKKLQEETDKINNNIDTYVNDLEKSSYLMDQKILIKRKKEDH